MLIVIATDPRTSHRPAEAVRVAAGLAAIGSLKIEVCFCQAAALILGKTNESLVDQEIITRHLPTLAQHAEHIWTETGDPFIPAEALVPYDRVGLTELAQLANSHAQVVRF